jgi:hypothetical protein
MSDSTPKTTAELLSRVDRAWEALEGTVSRLTPAQLTDVLDPAGWAVKDHLMHVAAWEAAFLGRFTGKPVHEVLGLEESGASWIRTRTPRTPSSSSVTVIARSPRSWTPRGRTIEQPGQGSQPWGTMPSPARWRTSFRPPPRARATRPRRGSAATRGSTTTPTTTGSASSSSDAEPVSGAGLIAQEGAPADPAGTRHFLGARPDRRRCVIG